jgi:hypothetical protein
MCTALVAAMVIAAGLVWSPLFRQACLAAALLLAMLAFVLVSAASAHRLAGHDYRSTPHWCTWSAATACTRWKARGGKFICPPGSMSVGCQDQKRRERERLP